MRISLLIVAGLLVTACDGRDTTVEGERTGPMAGTMENDAAGAFAVQPPTAEQFVERAAMSDMYEIEAGKLAADRAGSEEVRAFGRMMVAEHTQSAEALKAAAQQAGRNVEMPRELDSAHQAQIDVLRNLDDEDFDREYVNQQLAAHRKSLEMLKAYAGDGDVAELRQFAQQTIPVVQKHYDQLERDSAGMPGSAPTAAPMKVNDPAN